MTASAMPPSRTGGGWRQRLRLRFLVVLHRCVRRSLRRVHGRASARGGRIAAAICATISRSRWKKPFAARAPRSRVNTAVPCEACGGTGAEAGHRSPSNAPPAPAHGKVRAQQGFFTIERTCPHCRGTGRIIRNPCKACRGSGHVQKERTLSVDVPAGVEEGTRIRLSGEGQAGIEWRPAGRSLHLPFDCRAPDLPARRPRSLLPRAGVVRHGGAGRQHRSADLRRRPQPRSPFPKARNPDGSSACAARACR